MSSLVGMWTALAAKQKAVFQGFEEPDEYLGANTRSKHGTSWDSSANINAPLVENVAVEKVSQPHWQILAESHRRAEVLMVCPA